MSASVREEQYQNLEAKLSILRDVWDEIGISHDQRDERTKVVFQHIHNLCDEMVKEEELLKTNLQKNVQSYKSDMIKLCSDLGLEQQSTKDSDMTLLELENHLRETVDKMAKEKHERIKTFKRLKTDQQHLCDVLCATPFYIPSSTIPTRDQLDQLSKHISKLTLEKSVRHKTFLEAKKDIIELLEDLDQPPDSSFARDIVCEEEDSFLLSSENMEALKVFHRKLELKQKEMIAMATELRDRMFLLWERLNIPKEERQHFKEQVQGYKLSTINALKEEITRCEVLKQQNMKKFIEQLREELQEWWEKCYISQEQRNIFTPFKDDDCTEDLLSIHEREVQRMKKYYEHNKPMLEKVAKRETLWADYIRFEKRANDPNRFNNRGGGLLQEEKARNKLQVQLPKLEKDLSKVIGAWEEEHICEFRVHDMRFMDYIAKQWENFHIEKENEKQQRHKAKSKLMEEEMIYGSKPTASAKKRFLTPAQTPTKTRRMNETNTPMTAGRVHQSAAMSMRRPPPKSAPASTPRRLRPTNARVTRKALAERNGNDTAFSHTTLSSGGGSLHGGTNDISIMSIPGAASYKDFATEQLIPGETCSSPK